MRHGDVVDVLLPHQLLLADEHVLQEVFVGGALVGHVVLDWKKMRR